MARTLSQQLAEFIAGLKVEDCPPAVIDKAKAVLLHGLLVGLASLDDPDVALGRAAIAEDTGRGARLLGFGTPASRADAAFVNSLLLHARGQDDSYRMLTHPGPVVLPAALAEGEGRGQDGRALLAAIIAGYEVQCRLAADVVPAVQDRGFRSSALFGIFGATAAAGRIRGLSAEQLAHALALASAVAAGGLEPSRVGTREMTFQEPLLCATGIRVARLAQLGATGAASCLEGPAGFFATFAGTTGGELPASFHGERSWESAQVVAGLGERWELLGVTMKIYSTAGFNQPVIEAVATLARRHDLTAEQVARIDIEMNPWEVFYPSPRFARAGAHLGVSFDSTRYFAASALLARGYPSTGRRLAYGGSTVAPADPPELEALIARTQVRAGDRRQYAPRVTIETTSGQRYVHEMTGDEFKWDFATERQRVAALLPALPLPPDQLERLIEHVATLERCPTVDALVDLTVVPSR
ncbi:MAG: hypothetical protein KatS3mg061_2111 [Dehalococcoidia bacterium]|nr:MAG: hypothetical protein KatS3mg061_2111 [Dehalococcoidia bacterium]